MQLAAYVNKDLDDVILGKLQTGFDAVRKARIKIILRFMYNDGTTPTDASKAQILTHIQQLKPLLIKNADVILMMNAGFIGEYGGWYNSSHGLDNDVDQKDVLLAILGALPTSRSVVVQRPSYKETFFPGGPTSPAAAHDGSNKSRTGHHDACYLASADDFGTYLPPVAQWMDYVAKDTQYVPMQGAMCALNPPRTDCGPAQAETAAHHFTTMSGYYAKSVIDAWKTGGCYDTIRKNLGYRFELTSASFSSAVRPGSALGLRVHLVNKGYSAPINARPFKVVLTNGANRMIADVPGVDVRTWAPGQDVSLDLWFRVPAGLAPGKYELALFLPDDAPSLAAVPEYAIRIADQGIFNVFTGDNTLGTVTVDGSTPGGVDPAATTFAYLPP